MSRERCDICRGDRYIRLPVYRPVSAIRVAAVPEIAESSIRTFPCPQCAPTVPEDRIATLQHGSEYPAQYEEHEDFLPHVKRSTAHALVEGMLRSGFIKFETIKGDPKDPFAKSRIRATLAAAHPTHLISMDARISERQKEIASEAASIAAAEIQNWGSYYGRQTIEKDLAIQAIKDSIKSAIERRADWKPA